MEPINEPAPPAVRAGRIRWTGHARGRPIQRAPCRVAYSVSATRGAGGRPAEAQVANARHEVVMSVSQTSSDSQRRHLGCDQMSGPRPCSWCDPANNRCLCDRSISGGLKCFYEIGWRVELIADRITVKVKP